MVQVSPDFLAVPTVRTRTGLVSMLPFRSLSISTLEGRKGVYVLITKDEDRAQSLRLRKPSVRKKLSETKAEPGHTDKKKVREQERKHGEAHQKCAGPLLGLTPGDGADPAKMAQFGTDNLSATCARWR